MSDCVSERQILEKRKNTRFLIAHGMIRGMEIGADHITVLIVCPDTGE